MKKHIIAAFALSLWNDTYVVWTSSTSKSTASNRCCNDCTAKINTPQEIADRETAKLKSELNLTSFQEAKVNELNLGVAMKNQAIMEDASMSQAKKDEFIQSNLELKRKSTFVDVG